MKYLSLLASPLLICALSCPVLAADVIQSHMVKDNNLQPVGSSSNPSAFMTMGDRVYFRATTPETGQELFVTDGISSEPQLAHDFAPGSADSFPEPLGEVNGRLIVAANDGIHGMQLWGLLPATGTAVRLTSVSQQPGAVAFAKRMAVVGTRMLFAMDGDRSLWSTDGTAAGTAEISSPTGLPREDSRVCELADRAIVALYTQSQALQFWTTDGTRANTTAFADFPNSVAGVGRPMFVAADAGHCYFLASAGIGWALWRSDGAMATTRMVVQQGSGYPTGLAIMATNAYVATAHAGTDRVMLWRSNGNDAVLNPVYDGPYGDVIRNLVAVGNRLAFYGPVNNAASNVLVTDGTVAGTQPSALPAGYYPYDMRRYGERVLVPGGSQAWLLDPPSMSVTLLNATGFANRGDFADLNGLGIGSAEDAFGRELWKTNGTTAGTVRLQDVWSNNGDSVAPVPTNSTQVLASGDVLLMTNMYDAITPNQARMGVWRTDGSESGTWELPPLSYQNETPMTLAAVGNGAILSTAGSFSNYAYYRIDAGLQSASHLLHSEYISPVMQSLPSTGGAVFGCNVPGDPGSLCAFRTGDSQPSVVFAQFNNDAHFEPVGTIGNAAIFGADNQRAGVWRTDGTAPGTFHISDVMAQTQPFNSDAVGPSVAYAGKLYFGGCVSSGYCGLMQSDGTVAGTSMITNLPGDAISSMVALQDRFVFLTQSVWSTQLWSSDGTASGTLLLNDIGWGQASPLVRSAGLAHFTAKCPSGCENAYYVTDGNKGGTHALAMPPGFSPTFEVMVALDDHNILYSCTSSQTGTELCASDSATGTTRFLRDINPGPAQSSVSFIGQTSNAAYFVAEDGHHGRELWQFRVAPDALFKAGFE